MPTLTPAYGRDYKTDEEAIKDYVDGKDFVYNGLGEFGGRYCSIRDFKGEEVKLRFNRKEDFCFYKDGGETDESN